MIRRSAERLAALAAVAALVGALFVLLLAVPWAWAVVLIGVNGFALGWVCATWVVRGRADGKIRQWEALADELEDRWNEAEAELAKAMAANKKLHEEMPRVHRAGFMQGQVLQADREAEGL